MKLAERANEATSGTNPLVLRILAAAYAQQGQFSEAIETAEHALKLATDQRNSALANALQSELDLYRNGLPYRYGK